MAFPNQVAQLSWTFCQSVIHAIALLLKAKLVELMASEIQPKLSSETYNLENHCDYHGAMVGHSMNMCELLKQKIQGLIKGDWLEPEVHVHQPENYIFRWSLQGNQDLELLLESSSYARAVG